MHHTDVQWLSFVSSFFCRVIRSGHSARCVPESWDGAAVAGHGAILYRTFYLAQYIEPRKHCCCHQNPLVSACVFMCILGWSWSTPAMDAGGGDVICALPCEVVITHHMAWPSHLLSQFATLPSGQQRRRRRAIAPCLDIHARAPLQTLDEP
jgi:hypothetical protein